MTAQIVFIILTAILLLAIVLLFVVKSGLQLQYLRLKNRKKPGSVWDFIKFKFSDKEARKLRVQAFLLFPMLYPMELDEPTQELNELKRKVKRIHIAVYGCIILLVILGIYSEKVFPAAA